MMGSYSAGAASFRLANYSGTSYTSSSDATATTTAVASMVGYHIVTRTSGTQYLYVKGAGTTTISVSSLTPAAPAVNFLLSDLGGLTGNGSLNRLCFVTIGTGLSGTEASGAITTQNTLQTALGR